MPIDNIFFKEYEVVISMVAAIISVVALLFIWLNFSLAKKQSINLSEQIKNDRKTKTLEYVTAQFDRLATLGARSEMNKTGEKSILDYLNETYPDKTCEPRKKLEQLLLEYVYTFNRIGAGIKYGAFDEQVIFNIWAPSWFIRHGNKFETFIDDKRENNPQAYSLFDWLYKVHCEKIKNDYPQYKLDRKK